MRLKRTYSSREVAAFTGLTARQLQIWDASGLMPSAIPSHPTAKGGHTERRYTPAEVFELIALADLRARGFSIPQLHTLVEVIKTHFKTTLFAATGGGGTIQLLTDGRGIFARTLNGELYNLLESPGQPLLVVGDEGTLRPLGEPGKKVRRRKGGKERGRTGNGKLKMEN
jgi:DNA-binding transcriptional MerR regulator